MSMPTWLSVLEMAGNASLTVLGMTGIVPPGAAQLAMSLETSAQGFVSTVKAGGTPTDQEIMSGLMLGIAVLNGLKQIPGVSAEKVAAINEHIAAALDAITAYQLASHGLVLSDLTEVKPLP